MPSESNSIVWNFKMPNDEKEPGQKSAPDPDLAIIRCLAEQCFVATVAVRDDLFQEEVCHRLAKFGGKIITPVIDILETRAHQGSLEVYEGYPEYFLISAVVNCGQTPNAHELERLARGIAWEGMDCDAIQYIIEAIIDRGTLALVPVLESHDVRKVIEEDWGEEVFDDLVAACKSRP